MGKVVLTRSCDPVEGTVVAVVTTVVPVVAGPVVGVAGGVDASIDVWIRVSACESLLQPAIIGRQDPADVGPFQWNDKPPWHWWTAGRKGFNAWQDGKAGASGGRYPARYASSDRTDPCNAAGVAAWQRSFP